MPTPNFCNVNCLKKITDKEKNCSLNLAPRNCTKVLHFGNSIEIFYHVISNDGTDDYAGNYVA